MKTIIIILLIILSYGCCRFIPQKCITNTVDTLIVVNRDTIITVKDTTIWLPHYIPGKKVIDSIPYPVYMGRDGLVNSDTLFLSVPLAKAWAVLENSILKGKLVQRDTVLQLEYLLRNAIRQTTILRDSIVVINNYTTLLKKQKTSIKFIMGAIVVALLLILFIKFVKD